MRCFIFSNHEDYSGHEDGFLMFIWGTGFVILTWHAAMRPNQPTTIEMDRVTPIEIEYARRYCAIYCIHFALSNFLAPLRYPYLVVSTRAREPHSWLLWKNGRRTYSGIMMNS
jgi:hypothetical protein